METGTVRLNDYPVVDLLFGEEKTTIRPDGTIRSVLYTPALREALTSFCGQKNAGLLISGAYVGSDTFMPGERVVPEEEKAFVKETLGYTGRTGHATVKPEIIAAGNSPFRAFDGSFGFNMEYRPDLYRVESPDAVIPADSTGMTILRYRENDKSAGVAVDKGYKVLILGFPFETIPDPRQRSAVMKETLEFLIP